MWNKESPISYHFKDKAKIKVFIQVIDTDANGDTDARAVTLVRKIFVSAC